MPSSGIYLLVTGAAQVFFAFQPARHRRRPSALVISGASPLRCVLAVNLFSAFGQGLRRFSYWPMDRYRPLIFRGVEQTSISGHPRSSPARRGMAQIFLEFGQPAEPHRDALG